MDTLSYQANENNGLSFVLFVNGQSLCELIGGEEGIPYWLIDDDLPRYPVSHFEHYPLLEDKFQNFRIVCVCSCGEYGCGHTSCRMAEEDGIVTLREFEYDVSPKHKDRVFQFKSNNYKQVISQIVEEASKRKKQGNS